MAKFITIPTTVSGAPTLLFNIENLTYVGFLTTATFVVNSNTKSYTFTTSAAGATGAVAVIQAAILNPSGPIVNAVVLPSGVTIAALPVIA
tara:strand:+ start:266 stop:538 length:273 start_codon:yes stop_codon:yes gene_type:complete